MAYFERRITDHAEAADLLGETLLVLWRRASVAPSGQEGARMWMFGIARNVLSNYHRGVRRQLRLADALRDELLRTVQPAHEEHADLVVEAVHSLPPDLSELIRLVHWDGFKTR
nr:sigma-70 family RNA polymerase sigma factor [Ornithinimicrobium sp. F0845]